MIKARGGKKERDDDNFYVAEYLERVGVSATSTVSAPIVWQDLDDSRDNDHENERGGVAK